MEHLTNNLTETTKSKMDSLMIRDIVLAIYKYKNTIRSKDIDIKNNIMDDLIKL